MIYFDTSYLVKCYLPEPGFEEVRRLATEDGHVACCALGRIELMAAMHRHLRERSLAHKHFSAVRHQMELDNRLQVIHWYPVTTEIVVAACKAFEELSEKVFLRAADALHLACARDHHFAEIWSNDRHLIDAAHHFGLIGRNAIH